MSTSLPLSMLYLSLISSLAMYQTLAVVKVRRKTHIGLNHGGDENLARQIRVQANLLENMLPFSILFILAEVSGFSTLFLHGVGIVFVFARIAHGYGFSKSSGKSAGRYYGTAATWLAILLLVIVNIYQSFRILLG